MKTEEGRGHTHHRSKADDEDGGDAQAHAAIIVVSAGALGEGFEVRHGGW